MNDIFLITVLLFFLTACSGSTDTVPISLHPSPEYMPHPDVEPVMLEVAEAGDSIERFSDNIRLLYRVLHDDSLIVQKTELNVLTGGNVEISSLNDSTLLILDKMVGQSYSNEQLIQYNIKNRTVEIVAVQGRGPGDLFLSEELEADRDKVYIAMQGFQISVFNCDVHPCEHEKVIETKYNHYSIAPYGEQIFFLGMAPFGLEQSLDLSKTNQNLIFKMDDDGRILDSFFPVYQFKSPIVRGNLNEGGMVRRYPLHNSTIVTMEYYPFIYEYDDNGNLKAKYQIPGFVQSFYEYDENTRGSTFLNRGDNSSIIFTKKINSHELLIGLKERRDAEWISREEGFKGEEWVSYYIFNIENNQFYHIGDDAFAQPYSGQKKIIHVVDQGVIINELGTLYLINNSDA
jgi:hypothetical protein